MVIQPIFFVKSFPIFPIFNCYVVHIHREEKKILHVSN